MSVGAQVPVGVGAALHFTVVRNSDPSVRPAGWVQALRNLAYAASERRAPQDGRHDVVPQPGEPVVALSTHG